jgi:lysophospholipase L1-like esterase
MNERIKELAKQAGIEFTYDPTETPMRAFAECWADELEKFAELIVRECAQAFEAEVDTWKEMDPYQGSIKRQGTKAIKQHFGVEE